MRTRLAAAADPAKAPAMQAYMKSEMPFLGVPAPALKAACRDALAENPPGDGWRDTVLALWREAEFREERYAALVLLRRYEGDADLALVEELVVSGAWWDYVDSLAHVAGALLRRDPAVAGAMRAWSRDENLWKRRVSIICQLGFRGETDTALLADCIEANLDDSSFWIRKAIGWALREHSKTDAAWVHAFLREHDGRLSPLSAREALKWLVASSLA